MQVIISINYDANYVVDVKDAATIMTILGQAKRISESGMEINGKYEVFAVEQPIQTINTFTLKNKPITLEQWNELRVQNGKEAE